MIGVTQMVGRHHPLQGRDEAALRIGQEGRDASERLLLLGIEDVEDRADQQRVAGLLPMIAPLQRALGVDQDVGDVLDVTDLGRAAAHLQQRVVPRRARVGRVEQQAVREARPPSGGQGPVLALDVVDDGRPRQDSSVGTTNPTPLPERVGANAMTCSGPSWRRYLPPRLPSSTPTSLCNPAASTSRPLAHRADP